MIKTDYRPLYLQVIDKLRQDIEKYEEGKQLPSEFELAKQLGVSRATLREALRLLEDEGLLVRRHGVGTFVNAKPMLTAGIEELSSVTDMIRKANMEPGTIFLSDSILEATEEDQELFKQRDLEKVFQIERLRTADDVPVVYCLDRVPYHLLSNRSVHETKSLFQFLSEIGKIITYAVTYIEPIGYHETVSELLESDAGSALLLLNQTHYDQHDQPILYSQNYFRADKFKFHVLRKRFMT
ncbi:GntR family transcriptional regulator [Alkalicoccobacillus plakortidis]|uniref:GntR family transcriptional regulator n=1 Tax=Alkalicoccobacillus plakortidis TaxID=444060 RepID=A0ABT0XFX7_9BACI|nr:GntR family transcriptional regulator [Alkalicoccobacillus plakortidis]MCM2674685.1 GntR family transcriptional regulator [Alkalicoccobacillus plakortidis]